MDAIPGLNRSEACGVMLLPLCPPPHVAVLFKLDVDDVRAAADGAILDVLLARPCRKVDGHDDLLAAGIAGVAGLILHRRPFLACRSSPRPGTALLAGGLTWRN